MYGPGPGGRMPEPRQEDFRKLQEQLSELCQRFENLEQKMAEPPPLPAPILQEFWGVVSALETQRAHLQKLYTHNQELYTTVQQALWQIGQQTDKEHQRWTQWTLIGVTLLTLLTLLLSPTRPLRVQR